MGPLWSPLLDASAVLLCISLSAWYYCCNRHGNETNPQAQGYILENQVTHVRLLPVEASHTFIYPTLAILVSVDALERHKLDLWKGLIFGYGGRWGRLTGMRANPYFADVAGEVQSKTIREKLDDLLVERGFVKTDEQTPIDDAWMLTMPNYLGLEGINPLTVYFCYTTETLWLVVLEIHNTFGETHVHVLQAGFNEDSTEDRPTGFDHQWTFPREFHVSPFNDRSGFYTISIKSPSHPPTLSRYHSGPPRPVVRIHLHSSSDTPGSHQSPGPLKLTALLRPTAAYPLTTHNLLVSISRMPFVLLLSMPRILSQAWTLHYRKRLDVFLRPEPIPPSNKPEFATGGFRHGGGGVKWLGEGLLERYARRRVLTFLEHRVDQIGSQVTLVSADPSVPDCIIIPRGTAGVGRPLPNLVITYLAPRFFTIIFIAPSSQHALLLGSDTERIFSVSSRELFITAFSMLSSSRANSASLDRSPLQNLRTCHIPIPIPLQVPAHHPLDPPLSSRIDNAKATLALRTIFFLEKLERWIFSVAHARIVAGEEPWAAWERAERVLMERQEVDKIYII